jgi:eukaryotic-like serine/threonine-protein kinase
MQRRIYDRQGAPIGPELVEGLGGTEPFSCWYAKGRSRRASERSKPRPAPQTLSPPTGEYRLVADRYELRQKLGTGSMGEVWAARDRRECRDVAVKLLRPELVQNSNEARVRFAREAMLLSKIRSPNVVELYDYGTQGGAPYMAMELIQGTDLKAILTERGWLTPNEVCILVSDVAQGLHTVHSAGVIHRDLKPSNIVLCHDAGEAIAKVVDFGIARPLVSGIELTGIQMLGTAHYMSPEQCRGRGSIAVDHRADLWALGVIAFRALTGYMPHDGSEITELVEAILFASHPRPSALVPELTGGVDRFFERALAKMPDERFGHALEFADTLNAALAPLRSGEFSSPPR